MSELILGQSTASVGQMRSFLRKVNSNAPEVEQIFLEEGEVEGVCGDIAFCQAIHETNYFRFTGTAKIEWNNPAGLGVVGTPGVGERFPDWRTGIRAQIQHLKGYATTSPLVYPCVDNRYQLLKEKGLLGSSPRWVDLNGKWAYPGTTYGQSILKKYNELLKEPQKLNLVIAYSQQVGNKCKMGDTERDHMYRIALLLHRMLRSDTRLNLYIPSLVNSGNDLNNLKLSVTVCNQFINTYGGFGYEIDLHSDAGGYATGCSGLYVSQRGKEFIEPVYNAIANLTPWGDAGLRRRTGLYALNNTVAYTGVIEVSFHDSIQEARWIHDNSVMIATRLADGIYQSFTRLKLL